MFMYTRLLKDGLKAFVQFSQWTCFATNFWQFYLPPLCEIPEQLQGQTLKTPTGNPCIVYCQKECQITNKQKQPLWVL